MFRDSINYTNPADNPFLDISKQAVGGEQYISAMTNEWYIYGSSGHGRFARAFPVAGDGGYDNLFYDSPEIQSRYLKHKQYELKDHLGNVRVVVSDFKKNNFTAHSDPPYKAEVLAAYNYYPFGMLQPGMYSENNTLRYRFGFNGMLRDDDMTDKLSTPPDEGRGNSYDFGARMYNPRVTRFFGLDPMKLSFPWKSPYIYASDNPVIFIDVEGKHDGYFNDIVHAERVGKLSNDPVAKTAIITGAAIGSLPLTAPYIAGGVRALTQFAVTGASTYMRYDPDGSKLGGTLMGIVDPNPGANYPGFGDDIIRGVKSVWTSNILQRGLEIEKMLGGNLPANFPVIDKFKDGVATSIKSIDLSSKSYQNMGTLKSTLKGHIDKVAGFQGAKFNGFQIEKDEIVERGLEIAIPKGEGSTFQYDVIEQLKKYGSEKKVNITVIEVE